MERIKVHDMPGVEFEFVPRTGMEPATEITRVAVYDQGQFRGEVVHVARRRKAPPGSPSSTGFVTQYGWRPDGWRHPNNAKLTSKADAIRRLRPVVELVDD